ncbi:MAG: menaquinone biosynthesis protein [Candidatus Omnitrophica bacterium]|nr:menaquinone biosynthesis protein [Candidatus Omnitrophota bacterium]
MSSVPLTNTAIGRVPYLNCAPFFHGLTVEESWAWVDLPPRQLGFEAEAGRIVAGPLALADFLRLQDRFERLGPLGIAVRGRCQSVLLFSRAPVRQLHDATISLTDDTSTTALLLRLILEQRYALPPSRYERGKPDGADARLLIGDEALRFHAANQRYPYEMDLAFEWWLWQHLPMVFAVWAVRKDLPASDKQRLSRLLQQQVAVNTGRLEELAKERAPSVGLPPEEVQRYLASFIYRLSEPEERAITQFDAFVHERHLL